MRPREQLAGLTLPGDWKVIRILDKKSNTGGHFSVGYLAQHPDGRQGFLKAMDYVEAFAQPNTAEALKFFAEMYLFEKQICEACREHHLGRVVHAIDSGSILPDPAQPMGKVEYLIFELAGGDIRGHLDSQTAHDAAFMLDALHNVATGLQQLHTAEIAHQDLKPSNVLIFPGKDGSKIADLGRAWAKAFPAPHDSLDVAGDRSYAPPELLYSGVTVDERARRFGCDLYHFGSLIAFVFARVHMNSLIWKHLAPDHRPYTWGGSFVDVLPYVQAAFGRALVEVEGSLPNAMRAEVMDMIKQLCEPNPDRRGHPRNQQGFTNRFSFQRYISALDRLSKKQRLLSR
jgi:serine/threonine protein kinase